jgi:ribosomal protein S24E
MEFKITEQKEHPLLSRKELVIELAFDKATPSNQELKKLVASNTKADENAIVVKQIKSEFGARNAKAIVYIYKSKEDKAKMENTTKKQRAASKKAWIDSKKKKPAEGAEAKPEGAE